MGTANKFGSCQLLRRLRISFGYFAIIPCLMLWPIHNMTDYKHGGPDHILTYPNTFHTNLGLCCLIVGILVGQGKKKTHK